MPAWKWDRVVKGAAGWGLTGSSGALSPVTSGHMQENPHIKSFAWSEPSQFSDLDTLRLFL